MAGGRDDQVAPSKSIYGQGGGGLGCLHVGDGSDLIFIILGV